MSEYIVDYELIPLKWRDGYGLSDVDLTKEIVRCRDCKYLKPRDEECGGRNWCKRMSFEVTPDGFCAWAEPK